VVGQNFVEKKADTKVGADGRHIEVQPPELVEVLA